VCILCALKSAASLRNSNGAKPVQFQSLVKPLSSTRYLQLSQKESKLTRLQTNCCLMWLLVTGKFSLLLLWWRRVCPIFPQYIHIKTLLYICSCGLKTLSFSEQSCKIPNPPLLILLIYIKATMRSIFTLRLKFKTADFSEI
jgi:hypothetical protein